MGKSGKKSHTGKQARKKKSMAELADPHLLYEKSVQDVATEFEFVDKAFQRLRGRKAYLLREDFCGTANMCCEWVRRRAKNTAIGVDIDPKVMDWGRAHNLSQLKPAARKRVTLLRGDVRRVRTEPVDIVLAMNFSYQLFKKRDQLIAYFGSVRKDLKKDGVLFLDAFGGHDAYRDLKEKRKNKRFTYIWEQTGYNPITADIICHIHFRFPDGSRINKAFSYDWRLWTLPELREILQEAGFRRVTVHWEGTDEKTGEGNGVYSPATVGDADPGWVCFLSAEK